MADNKTAVSDEAYASSVFEEGGHLVIDLENIEEAKFENVPKGIYDGEIEQVDFGLSNNSGAPMWTVQISIQGGDHAGRKLFTYLSFSQKALPFTKATINRFAPELLKTKFSPEQVANEGTLLGKPVRIRVTQEEYNGEPRSRISQVLAPAQGSASSGGKAGGGFF